MITKKQSKLLCDTWSTINQALSCLDWTNYANKLLELTKEESKGHDRFRPDGFYRGLSILDEARYFAIKRLWEYRDIGDLKASDYFSIQKSCFAAASIMNNERFAKAKETILAKKSAEMAEIASWDYCDLASTPQREELRNKNKETTQSN